MSNPSDQYRQLLSQYQKAREEMRTAPRDGLQEELQTLARRVIAFECKNETERLKSLIATHHEAAAKIELARQKLQKLERAVISQEILIAARFPESDVIGLTLDLIAFERSALIGAQAVENLIAVADDAEADVTGFLKVHRGVSECLPLAREFDWESDRPNFAWMEREFSQKEPAAQAA